MNLFPFRRNIRGRIVLQALVVLLVSLLATAAGAQGEAITSERVPELDDDNSPVKAVLEMDRLPLLNGAATLTCSVHSTIAAPGMVIQIELPEGATVRGGDLSWTGDLAAAEEVGFSATVTFSRPGDTAVSCRALSRLDERNSIGDLANIYFSLGETETRLGFRPKPSMARGQTGEPGAGATAAVEPAEPLPAAAEENNAPPPPGLDAGRVEQEEPVPEAPAGSLTVTGTWRHPDRDDNQIGAREMLVELVNGTTWEHLAWCWTGLSGAYTCPTVSNPGSQGVRTRLNSYACYNGAFSGCDKLLVKNPDKSGTGASASFRFYTDQKVFADGTHDIGTWSVPTSNDNKRAYWALRDMVDTWRFIWFSGGGATSGGAGSGGGSVVLWKIDSTDGTYYSHGGSVHLDGADPLSDTTVIHEYAHNIMYNVYVTHQGNSFPSTPNCNPHTIQGASSTGCAWVEGWAEFIPSVVNNDPTYRWDSGASLDLEGPSWSTWGWDDGDDVEGRVAGALWDIYDTNNEGEDQYTEGSSPRFSPFWDIFWDQSDSTFNWHWIAWRNAGNDNSSAGPLMSMYQSTIDYRVGPANDDFANAVSVASLPYQVSALDTTGATTQVDDPAHPCGSTTTPKQSRSVWYSFTPSLSAEYNLNTNGSTYDTVLAVWTGTFGSLSNVDCDDDGGASTQSEMDVILNSGTTYYVEVSDYGYNGAGDLDLNISLNPPVAPSNLVATVGDPSAAPATPDSTATADDEGQVPLPSEPAAPDAAVVTLTWDDNSVSEYNFHVEKWNGSAYVEVAFVVGTSWADSAVSPDNSYTYRVRAHRHSDNSYSNYANTASATVPALPVAPDVSIYPSGSGVLMTWSYLADNTAGYEVWESPTPYFTPGDGGTTMVDSGDANTTSGTHSGALGDSATNHYYFVAGYNSIGQRALSNQVGEFDFALEPGS